MDVFVFILYKHKPLNDGEVVDSFVSGVYQSLDGAKKAVSIENCCWREVGGIQGFRPPSPHPDRIMILSDDSDLSSSSVYYTIDKRILLS